VSIFSKKQEVDLEDFCRDFYERHILNPAIEGIDIGAKYFDIVRKSIVEADQNFVDIDPKKFTAEMVLLRVELFALAWLHQFGDRSAVAQSVFTKHYLHEKKRDDIWDASEPYNQAIARSSTIGKTQETASGRVHIGFITKMRVDLFSQYHEEGHDPKCVARVLNRLLTDVVWKKGITAGLLMFTLCDRLGFGSNFEPSIEAQFRLPAVIRGFYDGFRQSLKKIKIKN
jgi:hypothetical protein